MHRYWVACLLVLAPLLVSATEFTWATLLIPGAASLSEAKAGEGFIFEAHHLLEQHLPEFAHRYEVTVAKRLEHQLAEGKQQCSTLTVEHPDRDLVGHFIPYLPGLPMEIVIREVDRSQFPIEGGRVVIEHLHQHAGLQGGVSPTRGYPQKLTEFIRLGLQHGSIISVSGSASGGNLLSMVSYKRLDYTFEFPLVTQAMSQTMRMPNALLSLPVAELRELVPTGIYCPRTPWGKAMALRIDRAIKQLVGQPATLLELYSSAARLEYAAELKAYFYSRSQWQLDD